VFGHSAITPFLGRLFVGGIFLIMPPNRMAEKEDRKIKRSHNTQKTPETRNLAVLELKNVCLKDRYTVQFKKYP